MLQSPLAEERTVRVRPAAMLVAVTLASVDSAESTSPWPRTVAAVECASAMGAATSMQLASAQHRSVRLRLRGMGLFDVTVPLPG